MKRVAVAGLFCGIYLFALALVTTRLAEPVNRDFYNALASSFLAGELSMPGQVDPAITALENPYEPSMRRGLVRWVILDQSLYNEKLYLYFGAAPAVLLFAPYLAVTGTPLPPWIALMIFLGGSYLFLVLAYLMATGGIRRSAVSAGDKRKSGVGGSILFADSIFYLVLGSSNLSLFIAKRAEVYEIAIASGMFFASLALASLIMMLNVPDRARRWGLLAAFGAAGAVGSRPNVGLVAVAGFAGVGWYLLRKGRVTRRDLASPAGLLLAGLALIALYNLFRFDSPFEFGLRYQLAAANMHDHPYAAPSFLIRHLYILLFRLPDLLPNAPYLNFAVPGAPWIVSAAKNFSLARSYSIFAVTPFLFGVFLPAVSRSARGAVRSPSFWIAGFFAFGTLFILSWYCLITLRHMADLLSYCIVAAAIGWAHWQPERSTWRSARLAIISLLGAISVVTGIAVTLYQPASM